LGDDESGKKRLGELKHHVFLSFPFPFLIFLVKEFQVLFLIYLLIKKISTWRPPHLSEWPHGR